MRKKSRMFERKAQESNIITWVLIAVRTVAYLGMAVFGWGRDTVNQFGCRPQSDSLANGTSFINMG
jgi:hypothetical protein